MKATIKQTLIAIVCLFAFQTVAFADNDKPITFDQLPELSQTIVKKNFADLKISHITKDTEVMDRAYDVLFTNGTEIEFDRKGNWTEVECRKGAVPAQFVPKKISKWVANKYPGQSIRKIEKDNREWDIELSDGTDITFNKRFKVTEVDR